MEAKCQHMFSPSCRDLHTGTGLTSYKNNACPPNGISLVGRDYVIATQLGKPALHAWTWHKVSKR